VSSLTRQKIQDAMAQVAIDLPDGAYWSMVHEILGVDYGEIFPILADGQAKEGDSPCPAPDGQAS
jgi:hypothetical protein